MDNLTIARRLLDYADRLETRDANLYRVRAYRRAAETVLNLDRPVVEILDREGRPGLEVFDGIGSHLSYSIEALVRTGELRTVHGDGGHADPEQVLRTVPGVGPRLARTLYERLGITSLEELERAAHEGRLGEVGVGPKRLRGLIDSLAGRLARSRLPEPVMGEPDVGLLLEVDRAYREQAAGGLLPTLAPRRFNPGQEPWLPVWETRRDGWRLRAQFSNTALAHRLGQTGDWVVIAFDDGLRTGRRTVVTETGGDLRGRRVVRGRERQCARHYQAEPVASERG